MYRDSMLLFPFETLCICCKNGGCQPNVQPRLLSISRVGDSNDGLDSLNAGVAAGDMILSMFQKSCNHQLRFGSLSHYIQGFYEAQVVGNGISAYFFHQQLVVFFLEWFWKQRWAWQTQFRRVLGICRIPV